MRPELRAEPTERPTHVEQGLAATGASERPWIVVGGALFALGVALFAHAAGEALGEPEIVNYSEGIVLHGSERILQGEPLWGDVRRPPYTYSAYPPLFAALGAALFAVFGAELIVLRALATSGFVIAMLLAGRIAARESGRPWAGWAAAGVGLGVIGAHPFAALARVDSIEIAFGMLTLERLLALERGARRPRLSMIVATLALAACASTKWTGLAPFAGLALRRFGVSRSWRDPVLTAILAGVGISALVFVALHLTTEGRFTQQVFFDQAGSGYLVRQFVTLNYVAYQLPLVLLAAWTVARRIAPSAGATLASAVLWVVFAQLKDGADHNYALWPIVLTVAVAGAGLPAMAAQARAQRSARRTYTLVALWGAITLGMAQLQVSHVERRGPAWRRDHAALHAWLEQLAPGPVLAEEPYYLHRHAASPWLSDPCHVRILARRGALPTDELLEPLRTGAVPWVLRGDVIGGIPGLDDVLAAHFERVFETEGDLPTGRLSLHRHRSAPRLPSELGHVLDTGSGCVRSASLMPEPGTYELVTGDGRSGEPARRTTAATHALSRHTMGQRE